MTNPLDEIYRCTPRQAKRFVTDILMAGLVPNLLSSPGMGKSSIFRQVAREQQLFTIDHRAAGSSPEDFTGLPEFYTCPLTGRRLARFAPFGDLFPIEGSVTPDGYQGWLLFLDEFNSAPKSIQAACYKVVLDRMVGQARLCDNVAIGMAGNLMTDGAITTELATPMKSRIITLEMQLSFTEWEEDVAIPNNYDHRLMAWLHTDKGALMDFDPDTVGHAFSCPRTIEFLDRLLKVKPQVDDEDAIKFAGAIGAGRAATFVQHLKVYSQIPTIKDILSDPANCRVPHVKGQAFAVLGMMTTHTNLKADIAALSEYADRFPIDQRILFYRMLGSKAPELAVNPVFRKSAISIARYLNPETAIQIKQAA